MGTKSSGRPSEKEQLPIRGKAEPPKMPKGMGEHAQHVWKLAVESLPHVLRPLDEPVLRLCCECYQLAMDGLKAGDTKTFLVAVAKYELTANKIGLTPHSRRVIKPVSTTEVTKEESPFDSWFNRGGLN